MRKSNPGLPTARRCFNR